MEFTLETSAFRISVRWPIYIINCVDKTKFLYFYTSSSNKIWLARVIILNPKGNDFSCKTVVIGW